jgi:hypothetical protein
MKRSLTIWMGRVLEDVQPDIEGKLWQIVCIQQGWSKNGIYWTKEALQGAVSLFEGAPVNVYQSDQNGEMVHLNGEARSARGGEAEAGNNAGLTAKPRYEERSGRGLILADYHCTDPKLQATAAASVRAGVPCPIGFSIDGEADLEQGVAEGRRGIIGHAIHSLNELTPVTRAAAGGRTIRIVAGADTKEEMHNMNLRKFLEAALRKLGRDAGPVAGYTKLQVAEAVAKHIQESVPDQAAVAKVAGDFAAAGKEEEAEKVLETLIAGLEQLTAGARDAATAAPASAVTTDAVAAVAESVKSLSQTVSDIQLQSAKDRCSNLLNSALEASKLPSQAQDQIRKRRAGQVFESEHLAEDIEDMRKLLAGTVPASGVVQESQRGNTRTSVGSEPIDRARAAIHLMFDGKIPQGVAESDQGPYKDAMRGANGRPPASIKQLYILVHDDPGMTGRLGKDALVNESTRADFPETVGDAMNKQVVKEYTNKPQTWRDYVTVNPDVKDYKNHKRIMQGGIGLLPSVAEGDGVGTDTYIYGILGREDSVTYKMTKSGLLIGLTRELLLDDDMQSLRNTAKKLGKAARYTFNKFLYALQIGQSGGTINNVNAYTGFPIYNAAHNNLGSAAFGYQAFVDMITRFKAQREFGGKWELNSNITTGTTWTVVANRGIRVGMDLLIKGEIVTVTAVNSNGTGITVSRPAAGIINHSSGEKIYELLEQIDTSMYHFTVPESKWQTAWELFYSNDKPDTANNNGNALRALAEAKKVQLHEVHEMYLGGNTNNFYGHADKDAGTGLEVAFLNGNENPDVFLADMPNAGTMLRADQTDYKCRFEFTGSAIDPQMMQANIP